MNPSQIIEQLATETAIPKHSIQNVLNLLEDGATIPFIARYRKEQTNSLDEVQITSIRNQYEKLLQFIKRKASILDSLRERDILTDKLEQKINKSKELQEIEDIYLPFKPKRKTRGVAAREKGLAPLATSIVQQHDFKAADFINPQKEVHSAEDALNGALDIIAEEISENSVIRADLRAFFFHNALLVTKVKTGVDQKNSKFQDYFEFEHLAKNLPGHRLLAIQRGEKEKELRVSTKVDESRCHSIISRVYKLKNHRHRELLLKAVADSFKRLLSPSLDKELRKQLLEQAEQEAIEVFGKNLQQLLLDSPLGQLPTLAIDPGFRTGAKVACLNAQGTFLDYATIYPTHGGKKREDAAELVNDLIKKHEIQAIAIGNGTASRETEQFIKEIIIDKKLIITLVNEDGASIYSASEVARQEFPDLDLTIRGAISIGRRLQDPLSELVKIDPKSLGIGQYQHDVNQSSLKAQLDDVVATCVNKVGVELNNASVELLTHVSGLGPVLAKNIVQYRQLNGAFNQRKELLKVPRLGAKAYEQCAGFLRIRNGKNPLDNSGVHPERYQLVSQIAEDLHVQLEHLIGNSSLCKKIEVQKYVNSETGKETLQDILEELEKPGRDPRTDFQQFSFSESINEINDLEEGMVLPGVVTNITKFGAFVDLGIHTHGLIHISQMADHFVKDPNQVVSLNQKLQVRVIEVDIQRKRISLSLRKS